MNIVLFIVFFAVGFFVGRKTTKRSFGPITQEERKEFQEESREALSKRAEKRKARILALAKKQSKITNDEVEDMFCVSDRTANRYLNELETENKIKQVGTTGRGVHYRPI